jgi:hypothetical protein
MIIPLIIAVVFVALWIWRSFSEVQSTRGTRH